MSTPAGIVDQQDRALARLLELGLEAAEKVQARLMASEDDALVGELALALNRTSRNVRQTVALQMRAARERRQEDQAAAAEDRRVEQARTSHRKTQLKAAVERLIWNEYDGDDEEAEALVDRLDDRVGEEALYEDFTAEPIEAHIARLCAELGLADSTEGAIPAPEAASAQADDADDYWRSSA